MHFPTHPTMYTPKKALPVALSVSDTMQVQMAMEGSITYGQLNSGCILKTIIQCLHFLHYRPIKQSYPNHPVMPSFKMELEYSKEIKNKNE